jgi:pimeloyl-ACP methyl ester carboxylesterase
VSGLVIAEATPEADPEAVGAVGRWLASWPLPFPSAGHAREFFGGDTLRARAWTSGLERRADGLWPAFEPDVLVKALADAQARSYWDEWASIRCPALVVRACTGARRDEALRMADLRPGTRLAEIEDAGHDVHLDQPERWRNVLLEFIAGLG